MQAGKLSFFITPWNTRILRCVPLVKAVWESGVMPACMNRMPLGIETAEES